MPPSGPVYAGGIELQEPIVEDIKRHAGELLTRFIGSQGAEHALVEELRPEPGDYARVFKPEAAEVARRGYEMLWLRSPRPEPKPGQSEVSLWALPAGLLVHETELSRRFPNGYRRVALLLDPHHVWIAWKYHRPGASTGLAYDGLVWLDGRFAWFPKPWRVLG